MILVAISLVGLGALGFVIRLLLGPSLADRVVALDGIVITMVATVLLMSIHHDTDRFLDLAVVVAIVGFVGTAAAARFIERRGG